MPPDPCEFLHAQSPAQKVYSVYFSGRLSSSAFYSHVRIRQARKAGRARRVLLQLLQKNKKVFYCRYVAL